MPHNEEAPDLAPEELDRVEELVRYLAGHDGRMPTDDLPLAWWLVDALDLEMDHPVRQLLAGIPVTRLDQNLNPKKAHAWNSWLRSYDQLTWISRGNQTLDDALAKDKALHTWFNDTLSRHHIGTLGTFKSLLLKRNPLWDPERLPDTKASKGQMAFKVGINAVREFYLEHKHTEIPEGYTVAGLNVYEWWHSQRSRYASDGGMKEHLRQQFARLGNLGVDLRTDKQRAKEDIVFRNRDRLAEIADYLAKHGMSALPEQGQAFVNTARMWIGDYERGRLNPALQEALEAIPGWSWEGAADLEPLRTYALTYGHVDIARDHVTDDGRALGAEVYRVNKERWITPHRSGPVRRRGEHVDRISKDAWQHAMDVLRQWHRTHSVRPEPDRVTDDGFRIGDFYAYVVAAAAHGLLTWSQLRDLTRASNDTTWLDDDPATYETSMQALERFAQINRHCHPAWGRRWDGANGKVDLSRFVLRLCTDHEAGDLSPTDTLRVENLPGWSWSRRERVHRRQQIEAAGGQPDTARSTAVREPVRSVRTDVADPDSTLNRAGLRQFLPTD